MFRRCKFLDELPAYNYNQGFGEVKEIGGRKLHTSTKYLGSTLMSTMLEEVTQFCNSAFKAQWSLQGYNQVSHIKHDFFLIFYF